MQSKRWLRLLLIVLVLGMMAGPLVDADGDGHADVLITHRYRVPVPARHQATRRRVVRRRRIFKRPMTGAITSTRRITPMSMNRSHRSIELARECQPPFLCDPPV